MAAGFVLIDGEACALRAYYAVSPRVGTKGRFRSAAHGLMGLVLRLIRTESPAHAAVVLGSSGPWSSLKRYLQLAGIPVAESLARSPLQTIVSLLDQAKGKGITVLLVTTRTVLLQKVNPGTTLLNPAREGLRFTPERVKDLLGVSPEQVPDWLALVGDPPEGIPGVKGLGPKTAARLLGEFGTLDRLLASRERLLEKIRNSLERSLPKIRAGYARARMESPSKQAVSLGSCLLSEPRLPELTEAFAQAGMSDLLADLVPHRHPRAVHYQSVLTPEHLRNLLDRLSPVDRFSVDTETTGLNTARSELVGISLSAEPDAAFYIPVGHRYPGAPPQLPLSLLLEKLGPLLSDPSKMKIGQNLKFDLLILRQAGFTLRGPIFDTMVASYLVHPDRASHSLDALSLDYFGYKMIPIRELIGSGKTMAEVEIPRVTEYACEDADLTLQLYHRLIPELKQRNLARRFLEEEMPFLLALADLEGRGLLVDGDELQDLLEQAQERIDGLSEEIFSMAGRRFRLESPKELRQLLEDSLGLVPPRRTPARRFSLSQAALRALKDRHPIVERILHRQEWVRFAQGRLAVLQEQMDPATGRYRAGFHQTGTGTGQLKGGRLFSPTGNEAFDRQLRSLVRAPSGFVLLQARYLQPREKLMADVSGGPALQPLLVRWKRQGGVSTLMGRFRRIPQLNSSNPSLRRAAEKEALETFLEGSLADLLKRILVLLFREFQQQGRKSGAVLLLPEGLLVEAAREELDQAASFIRESMAQAASLKAPWQVDLASGARWDALTPL